MKRFLARVLGFQKSRNAGVALKQRRRVCLEIENLESRQLMSANPTSCMACHGTGVTEGTSVSSLPISTQMEIMRATGTENASDADKVIQTTKAEVDGVNRMMAGLGVAVTLPALGPGLQFGLAWWSGDQLCTGISEATSGQKQNSIGGQAIQSVAGDGTLGKTLTTVYDTAPPFIALGVNFANGPSKPPADPGFMANSAQADLACANNYVQSWDYQGAIDYLKGSIQNNTQVDPRCGTPAQIQTANQSLADEVTRLETALKSNPGLQNPPTNSWSAQDLATWRGLMGPDKFAEMSRAEFEATYGKSPPIVKDATPPSPTTNEVSLDDLKLPDDLTNTSCDQSTTSTYQSDLEKMKGLNEDDLQKFLDGLEL